MSDPDQAGDMDHILARFGEVQEEYEHHEIAFAQDVMDRVLAAVK